ncbi:hypothetical protein B0H11DRAFT_1804819 [Mycena galericulata]|nr:hypothetical protein B0H11DRAFT_1804819 [Mycena galericulata]
MCRLCTNGVESMHHLFVDCARFDEWRRDAAEEVETRTGRKLTEAGIIAGAQTSILHAAKSLFIDEPSVWPLKVTQYYLGQIPSTRYLITSTILPDSENIKRRRLATHIASEWHTSAIRLARRIFGSVQRIMATRAAGTTL